MMINKSNMQCIRLFLQKRIITILIIITSTLIIVECDNKFQPYNLNGGLISAIAGKNYILLASDTRFTNGYYDILSRQHLQSRLYKVSSPSSSYSSSYYDDDNDDDNNDYNNVLNDCGSIKIPNELSEVEVVMEDNGSHTSHIMKKSKDEIRIDTNDGALIGSSGCASDCEALKRHIITEIQSKQSFSLLSTTSISTLLSQILYSRRSFPFYAFCVTAGFDNDGDGNSGGVVHVYDAIGSHERVAVGAVGSGKELLQPILDRLFSASIENNSNTVTSTSSSRILQIHRDNNIIEASQQIKGLLDLTPPVQTYVDCDNVEEAIGLLVCAYRSVAEREISVGDDIVICIIRKDDDDDNIDGCNDNDDGYNGSLEIRRFPLKKH